MREIFLILLSLMVKVLQTSDSCPASNRTLKYVDRCPTTSAEWQERSCMKKCADINQNCTERRNFQYHCLINVFLNATVEVCAPVAKVLGSNCAEYNTIGQRIQDNNVSCEECPFQYDSNVAHEYQECYARIKRGKGLYMKFQDTNTDTCPVGWFIAAIISIIFNVILGIFAACAIVQLQRRSTKKKRHFSPENPTPENPRVHPPQDNAPGLTDKEGADDRDSESVHLLTHKEEYKTIDEQTWTSEYTRGWIRCLRGVSIPCRPVTSALSPLSSSDRGPTKKEGYSCVAAIQLGERYCGFAFSKEHDPANVLLDIVGSPQPPTTTTRLLLRKGNKREVKMYGNDACTEYIKGKCKDHIYFDELNFEEKGANLCIKDSKKKEYDAKDTYKKFLERVVRYAREQMGKDRKIHDPKFIFTIPDHWKDLELKLIKEVIKEIFDVAREKIHVLPACLAVSPFLHEVKEEVLCHNFNVNNLSFNPGTKYAVLNLGSRFCDIRILEVVKEKQCKDTIVEENEKPLTDKIVDSVTERWDDTSPEECFMKFLESVFSSDAMVDTRQKYPEIYFTMLYDFENWKTKLVDNRTEIEMTSEISSVFENVVKEKTNSTLETRIKLAHAENSIELERGSGDQKWFKLKLKKEKVKDCFSELIQKTSKLVDEHIIQKRSDLKCVCMTGVYAKVKVVQDSMKKCFKKRTVVIPSIPDLVVAQGAAFLGHKLDTAANNEYLLA